MSKKLYRSQTDKIIAGVAGGLAEYFGIDSSIIRLFFILVVAFGGSGILIYAILWLIMPKGPSQPAVLNEQALKDLAGEVKEKAQELKEEWGKKSSVHSPEQKPEKKIGSFFGWILIILGLVFLANNFMPDWMRQQAIRYWPLFFIVAGIFLVWGPLNKK